MRRKLGSRFLLALFALTIVCLITSPPHHGLMNGLIPFGAVCCHAISFLPDVVVLWIAVMTRTVIVATLIFGLAVLASRLWRTHCFVAHLDAVTATVPPARLVSLCAELGLTQQVVALTTPIPLAFCVGLLKPRIFVNTGLMDALTDREFRAVLLHEDHHRRRLDPLRTLLAESAATMLFFLPVVPEWRDLFLTSAELAADRHAAHLAGRSALAGALHKLLTYPQAIQLPSSISGINGLSATDARIAQLLGDTSSATHLSSRSLVSSSLILMLSCVVLHVALL